MYYEKYFPFYLAYADPMIYNGEKIQEKEFALMKSYYPEMARKIQEKVEEECQRLDYEGSRIYDEYPDRRMLKLMSDSIGKKIDEELSAQSVSSGFPGELAEVLFYHGIYRRRCRRKRCRGY